MLKIRPREMSDGSLHYPKRGEPPDLVDNYQRDENDPYILQPQLPDCIHRKTGIRQVACGTCHSQEYIVCLKALPAGYKECTKCIGEGGNL